MDNIIFHIAFAGNWNEMQSTGKYIPPAFQNDGFIHCSEKHQLEGVANRIFAGKHQLLLLCIDESKVKEKVIRENLEGGNSLYPHIYGPLNTDAVSAVLEWDAAADGQFRLPAEIR
jgi:uncharacterized protein (DUF952 family)